MPSTMRTSHAADELAKRRKKRPLRWMLAVILIAVLAAMAAYQFFLHRREAEKQPQVTEAPQEKQVISIAVLPFVNMSADPEQVYFCDGIADAILTSLTHVGDLRVIARSSSFAFRGDAVDIHEVGEKLDADWVLEGGVQKAGNRLRITAQLIKVDDLSHLFSNVYEREMEDVFAIQEEIAAAVVDSLRVKLPASERAALGKRYTDNPRAYELYLLAHHTLLTADDFDDLETAERYLRRAIELDPGFALAYIDLTVLHPWLLTLEEKEALIVKALELDDSLAEGYIALGSLNMYNLWDFDVAEKSFTKAIALNPGNERARTSYAKFLRAMGRNGEALEQITRATELDPLYFGKYSETIAIYAAMDRYDEAVAAYEKAIAISPDIWSVHYHLLRMYLKQGKRDRALEHLDFSLKFLDSTSTMAEFNTVRFLAYAGKTEKAGELLADLLERPGMDTGFMGSLAVIYIGLGETGNALDCLEKAYEERDDMLVWLKSDWEFDALRSEPRFRTLMKKIGFPEN